MLYFPFYGHHPYSPKKYSKPKNPLNPEELALFYSRWNAYHSGKSAVAPSIEALPIPHITAPPTPIILPTTNAIPPTQLRWWITTSHPLPKVSEEDYPILVDHLLHQEWSDIEFYESSMQALIRSTARNFREARLKRPITYADLHDYSCRYGHNVIALTNWLLQEYERTGVCRLDISTLPHTPVFDEYVRAPYLNLSNSVDIEWMYDW